MLILSPTVALMSRRLALVALPLALVVGGLSACTQPASIPPAEPGPTAAPLFASDDEALEAATAAYAEFLRVSGEILRDGGADPERLRPLVSDEVYETEAEGFARLRQNAWRSVGQSEAVGVVLQQHLAGDSANTEVIVYVCVDLTGTDVVDSVGQSVVDPARPLELAFEVVFEAKESGSLVIAEKSVWEEPSTCSQL